MALPAGTRLGPYEIVEPIGVGGMGEVYRALDTRLKRSVAIKTCMQPFTARFEREGRAIAALNHPHICTLYDVGPNYLVMEFVEGETLAARLRKGPLATDVALHYAAQIADAVAAAHALGIIHRDLKPGNIMLRPDGSVKVLDFGLAKVTSAEIAAPDQTHSATVTIDATHEGAIVGTAAYMSPEQARGEPVDSATDVWAFGCILYELLTHRRAFPGDTFFHTLTAILEREPDWSALSDTIPPIICDLLRSALRKDREHRARDLAGARMQIEQAALANPVVAIKRRGSTRKRIRSLAVLPLANLSGEPDQEYFADGMTDALITTLAQIRALRVISRTSVMRYKGVQRPLREIARELNVEAILEGAVLRSQSRVRITAQLIDARIDTHLWAKNYESELRDILGVQGEVAQAVAEEIKIALTPQERARIRATRPVDPDSYEAFLKGRYYWYRRSPDALLKSLEYLQHAVTIDPTYALAHAGIADTYNSMGWDLFAGLPPSEAFPKARRSAQNALELDPNCAEAHAALGWAATAYDWDWVTAEKAYKRAVELKPQYGPVHIWYSHLLHALGRKEESIQESKRAIECDPLGLILNVHLGWHHAYDRECEKAIQHFHKTIELEPGFILARLLLGETYEQMKRFAEAISEFETAVNLSGRRPVYLAGLGHAYAASGDKEKALNIVEELQERSGQTFVPARGIAEIYIGLADTGYAFKWLEKALQERNGWLIHIESNPRYDRLRSDSRYTDLVRRIGL